MSLNEILLSGGGLIILLTLVQISPLQLNPWTGLKKFMSWIGRSIGKSINQDVLTKLDKQEKEIKEIKEEQKRERSEREETDIIDKRYRIIRFADEIGHEVKHSKEHFDQIMDDITDYNNYCGEHKNFKNNKAVISINIIEQTYEKCLKENLFL